MLNRFINDAIRDHSKRFPRRLRHTRAVITGTQSYDLAGGHGFVRLLAVGYRVGEEPPVYLSQIHAWDVASAGKEAVDE